MKRCMKCNAEIEDDAKFCPNCGSVVESVNDSTPTTEQPVQEDLAVGAEGAQVLEEPKNTEEKKKRFVPKVAIISVAGLLVVCILAVVIYKFIGSRNVEGILYVKDHELRFGTGKEDENYEVTDEFFSESSSFIDIRDGIEMHEYVKMSANQRYIFYPVEEAYSSYTYFWRDLSKIDKDDEVEIDSDIISCEYAQVSEDGSKFFYIKGNDRKLYVYDRKADEKEKLDEDVSELHINKAGNYLIYQTEEEGESRIYELTLKNLEGDAEIIEKGAYIINVDAEKKQVYYMYDGDLYYKTHGKEEEELVSDVAYIGAFTDSNSFYYTREKEVNHKLSDYITDDLLTSDSKMLEPDYMAKPPAPNEVLYDDYKVDKVWVSDYLGNTWNEEKQEWGYWDYKFDSDAYNKACKQYEKDYETWEKACSDVEEHNNKEYERYQGKLDRDSMREWINSGDYDITYWQFSLYYWDGSKEHKVADDVADGFNSSSSFPAVSYQKFKANTVQKTTMTELYEDYLVNYYNAIDDFSQNIKDSRTLEDSCTLAYKETEGNLKIGSTSLSAFGNNNQFIFIDHNLDLKSVDVTKLTDDAIVTIDKEVDYFYILGNGTIGYAKDSKGYLFDLYIDKEKVASDVTREVLYFFPESDAMLCMKDYEDWEGTLYLIKDKKETKISKDVIFFCPYSEDNIALLKSHSKKSEGMDLELYKKGKLIPIDDEVSSLIWTKEMGYPIYMDY